MKLGYMTNAFGMLVGNGGGVTNAKDVNYVTLVDDKEAMRTIKSKGYEYFEMFDGNLLRYEDNPSEFVSIMNETGTKLLGVYIGCFYIFPDLLKEELKKIDRVCKLAKTFGAKHIVLGGGSVRQDGILDGDYYLLADGLAQASATVEKHGLIPSYHPHLGSMCETPEQINKLFGMSDVNFCPDIAHIVAGGGDAFEIVKTYYNRIKYVHLKDFDNGFVPLGEGKINLEKIIKFLQESGYEGDWLVEIDGYSGSPEYASEVSFKYLKKYFNNI